MPDRGLLPGQQPSNTITTRLFATTPAGRGITCRVPEVPDANLLKVEWRLLPGGVANDPCVRFNSDGSRTNGTYYYQWTLSADAVFSSNEGVGGNDGFLSYMQASAQRWYVGELWVPFYKERAGFKRAWVTHSYHILAGGATQTSDFAGGLWDSTAPITSVTIYVNSDTWQAGSMLRCSVM